MTVNDGDCNFNTATGLWYDNCETGNSGWSTIESRCSGKGMRVVDTSEALPWKANGVPSCSGWTWCAYSGVSTADRTSDSYGRCVK